MTFEDQDPPGSPEATETDAVSAAQERFRSCRWRATPDQGKYCTHRDVLPFAGANSFNPDAWCPDCEFFKLRRTPKKRQPESFGY